MMQSLKSSMLKLCDHHPSAKIWDSLDSFLCSGIDLSHLDKVILCESRQTECLLASRGLDSAKATTCPTRPTADVTEDAHSSS